MTIRLTKGKNKPDTLTCLRDDGSCTWTALNLPPAHDLGHYAIETMLGFRHAFFGLLAQGWAIQDFGQPNPLTGEKPTIPIEAIQTEALAGLLDMERRSHLPPDYAEFQELLACACAGLNVPVPELAPDHLDAIRSRQTVLLHRWTALDDGETLELPFP